MIELGIKIWAFKQILDVILLGVAIVGYIILFLLIRYYTDKDK